MPSQSAKTSSGTLLIVCFIYLLSIHPLFRVAAVISGSSPNLLFDFEASFVAADIELSISQVVQPLMQVSSNDATLNFIRTRLLQSGTGYRGGPLFIVFFSDGSGSSNSLVQASVDSLANTSPTLMTIAIGDLSVVNIAQLMIIAGQSSNYFSLAELTSSPNDFNSLFLPHFCNVSSTTTTTSSTPVCVFLVEDLVIVLDVSASVPMATFSNELAFLADIIQRLPIGSDSIRFVNVRALNPRVITKLFAALLQWSMLPARRSCLISSFRSIPLFWPSMCFRTSAMPLSRLLTLAHSTLYSPVFFKHRRASVEVQQLFLF